MCVCVLSLSVLLTTCTFASPGNNAYDPPPMDDVVGISISMLEFPTKYVSPSTVRVNDDDDDDDDDDHDHDHDNFFLQENRDGRNVTVRD